MTTSLNTYTSLFFLTNIYYLLDVNDIIYLKSFIMLTLTSVIYHYTKLRYLGYIDKVAVYNIIFQGGIRLLKNYSKSKLITICVIFNFLSVIYLYVYGYMYNKYSFDKEYNEFYHGILHFQSSIGHLLITLLMKTPLIKLQDINIFTIEDNKLENNKLN